MYAIFFDGEFKFKFTCFCLCSLKNRETKSFLRFFFTPRSHAAESLPGFIVDNHIGCQDKFHHTCIVKKKRHWLCAYCAPMFSQ